MLLSCIRASLRTRCCCFSSDKRHCCHAHIRQEITKEENIAYLCHSTVLQRYDARSTRSMCIRNRKSRHKLQPRVPAPDRVCPPDDNHYVGNQIRLRQKARNTKLAQCRPFRSEEWIRECKVLALVCSAAVLRLLLRRSIDVVVVQNLRVPGSC
jgi:hypothetical protein